MSHHPPLERSIWNTDPLDEFAYVVADFIWNAASSHENIEIEAKLGRLIDIQTQERIQLPVLSETIVGIQEINARFESSMTKKQHKGYNSLLNDLVARTNSKEYAQNGGARVSYLHSREVDYFYGSRAARTEKVRVTKDEKTGEVKAVVKKDRLADLNVYCPNGQFDYRISVNIETPVEPPPSNEEYNHMRRKDRLSYAHQIIQVDLTQVSEEKNPDEQIHELEVEFRDSRSLLQAAYASRSNPAHLQQWSPFDDMVLIFLNNVRLLIKNCPVPNSSTTRK